MNAGMYKEFICAKATTLQKTHAGWKDLVVMDILENDVFQEQMKEKQAAKDYTSIKVCIENLDNVDNQEIIEL